MAWADRLDPLTRRWWRAVGRPVDLDGAHGWLRAPLGGTTVVGDGWVAPLGRAHGGEVRRDDADAGLLPDLAVLDGPGFAADRLHPLVRDFYARTASWRMETWAQWSAWAWPGGEAIARLFGRRVDQLALPMRPMDVAHGIDSEVAVVTDAHGEQRGAAWLRRLRSTGEHVFSGYYSWRTLPGATRPSVHVTFPLPSGNVQVFLRPCVGPSGALLLRSEQGRFGDDGAYVLVRDGGGHHAARVPLHETFHVYVDGEGVLRTDHRLRLWSAPVVRLHYRLERR